MCRLILSKKFERDFSKLDKPSRDRVVEKLKALSGDPWLGKPLKGRLKDLWSLRIGEYRVLYQVLKKKRIVAVVTVRHRKAVYK